MFWIKPLDLSDKTILTTSNWPPTEGIKMGMRGEDFALGVHLYRNLTTNEYITKSTFGPKLTQYLDSWLHITVTGFTDDSFKIYYNGNQQILEEKTQVRVDTISPSLHRMVVGRGDVSHWGGLDSQRTLNMVFDELVMYDKPLTVTEIQIVYCQYLNGNFGDTADIK